jgi:hypothetical protein
MIIEDPEINQFDTRSDRAAKLACSPYDSRDLEAPGRSQRPRGEEAPEERGVRSPDVASEATEMHSATFSVIDHSNGCIFFFLGGGGANEASDVAAGITTS